MHRDISNGNILVAAEEQTYSIEKLPDQIKASVVHQVLFHVALIYLRFITRNQRLEKYLGKFRGFLIDGDMAIKYKEPREFSYHRSVSFIYFLKRFKEYTNL